MIRLSLHCFCGEELAEMATPPTEDAAFKQLEENWWAHVDEHHPELIHAGEEQTQGARSG